MQAEITPFPTSSKPMKFKFPLKWLLLSSVVLFSQACKKNKAEQGDTEKSPSISDVDEKFRKADTPILPIKKGDYWKYKVRVEVPEGITSEAGAALDVEREKTRTFLGKVKISEKYSEVDAFDVTAPGQPVERELVEIYEDRVMMRGTAQPDVLDSKPIWLEPAVPFVVAGMRPGQQMLDLEVQNGARHRGMKVVARENIKVPAGEFQAIRLLMTGNDGPVEIRRSTWFTPKLGIVKEEKTRYANKKLIMRETVELTETNVKLE